jgi:CheY-like chemotaxis protein
MTGWVVLDRLRADTQTASVPVVVFSAGDYAETVARAKQEGISHVLRKPFQLNQLLEACTLSE